MTRSDLENDLTRYETSRRRLVKAGLIAAPFIVTLKAMPLRASSGSLGVYDYGDGGAGGSEESDKKVKKKKKSFN